MVDVTYTPTSSDLVYNLEEGTNVIYNLGDIAWITAATALVWIMVPGISSFYFGLLLQMDALSMIFLGIAAGVGPFQ